MSRKRKTSAARARVLIAEMNAAIDRLAARLRARARTTYGSPIPRDDPGHIAYLVLRGRLMISWRHRRLARPTEWGRVILDRKRSDRLRAARRARIARRGWA